MSEGLKALKYLDEHNLNWHDNPTKKCVDVIKEELEEAEKKSYVLKTISDIIRNFNKGEFPNGECALGEITNILKGVLE